MRGAMLRDKWARNYNIMCFEIICAPSFGVSVTMLCDNADSHKTKIWQPYAAAAAAEYAKELPFVMPGQRVTDLPPVIEKST